MMHTREQTLERLDQIATLVRNTSSEQIVLDTWVTKLGAAENDSVACVLGWIAIKQLYGVHLHRLPFAADYTPVQRLVPMVAETGAAEMRAAQHVLFGQSEFYHVHTDDGVWQKVVQMIGDIADDLFTYPGFSTHDLVRDRNGDGQRVFLGRVTHIASAINQLYDWLDDVGVVCRDVADTEQATTR